MSFYLSRASESMLIGVRLELVLIVRRGLELTPVDFRVQEGVRTRETQARYVEAGASETMDSRHLTGHAVDLLALMNGAPSWHWSLYYPIARAIQRAARELDTEVRWGGVWDRVLNALSDDLEEEVAQYVLRRKAVGKRAFLDGPHFELSRSKYP